MPHPALLARAAEPIQDASGDADRLGYDAWLLPPQPLSASDRMIRRCSIAAGPIAFVAALALFVQQLA